jgi:hypothetical protein
VIKMPWCDQDKAGEVAQPSDKGGGAGDKPKGKSAP